MKVLDFGLAKLTEPDLRANGWSADERQLLFTEVSPASPSAQCAIGKISIERLSDVKMLVKNEFCNDFPEVPPDGSWMAYHSNVSGRDEVYVERYPELGSRQQISTGGGWHPLWSRDGRELVFSTPDNRQMLAVPIQSGATLVAGRPERLFEAATLPTTGGTRPYDLTPDGRFIVIGPELDDPAAAPSSTLVLVQNWTEELKRLVPTP